MTSSGTKRRCVRPSTRRSVDPTSPLRSSLPGDGSSARSSRIDSPLAACSWRGMRRILFRRRAAASARTRASTTRTTSRGSCRASCRASPRPGFSRATMPSDRPVAWGRLEQNIRTAGTSAKYAAGVADGVAILDEAAIEFGELYRSTAASSVPGPELPLRGARPDEWAGQPEHACSPHRLGPTGPASACPRSTSSSEAGSCSQTPLAGSKPRRWLATGSASPFRVLRLGVGDRGRGFYLVPGALRHRTRRRVADQT